MKRILSLAGACLLACSAPMVQAQSWPAKPVRWLVPFPPGNSSDITARLLSEKLSATWSQTIVVENRPGAGGTIATAEMFKAPADGYTIMSGTMGTHAIAPNLYKGLPYDPAKDLVAVNLLVDVPMVLVASPKAPGATLKEFLAAVKDNKAAQSYASPGSGTLNHMMGEMLKQATKLDFTHIPYKGVALVYPDMYSGAVSLMFDPILSATTQIRQGRLKGYAISATRRSPTLPDVPTMTELGYAGFDATLWLGLFAPLGTPAPVVAKLSEDTGRALRLPDVKSKLEELGGDIVGLPNAAFEPRFKGDVARWGKLVRELGVKLD